MLRLFQAYLDVAPHSRQQLASRMAAFSFTALDGRMRQAAGLPPLATASFGKLDQRFASIGGWLHALGPQAAELTPEEYYDSVVNPKPLATVAEQRRAGQVLLTVASLVALADGARAQTERVPRLALNNTPVDRPDLVDGPGGADTCPAPTRANFADAVQRWVAAGQPQHVAVIAVAQPNGQADPAPQISGSNTDGMTFFEWSNPERSYGRAVNIDRLGHARIGEVYRNGVPREMASCVLDQFQGIATAVIAAYAVRTAAWATSRIEPPL